MNTYLWVAAVPLYVWVLRLFVRFMCRCDEQHRRRARLARMLVAEHELRGLDSVDGAGRR